MRLLLTTLTIALTACASSGRMKLRPGPLSRTEYAVTGLFGKMIICARAETSPCGLSLSSCNDGMRYLCTTDVIIVDMTKQRKFPPDPASEEL